MKTRIVLLFGALALVASSGAAAQVERSSGFYGGVAIGKAKAKLNGSDLTLGSPAIQENRDEVDTAYKFFGGYQFSRYIAAELSYADFGKFTYIYNAAGLGLGEARVNYKADSWATSVVASIPLRDSGFSVTGRLGVALNTAERSALSGEGFTTTPPIPGARKQRLGFLWGIGGEYDFTPGLTLRLEFEHYGKFGEAQREDSFFAQTGRATIHMYSLNFIARF